MKLSEIYMSRDDYADAYDAVGGIPRKPRDNDKAVNTYYFELTDPNTGKNIEISVDAHYHYDSGDVGFGVGYGKSPYRPTWEFDYAEVDTPFTFMGKRYKAGEPIDMDDFKEYFATAADNAQLEAMYNGESTE